MDNNQQEAEKELQKLKAINNELLEKISLLQNTCQIDQLTGLYNRSSFEERLSWMLSTAARNNHSVAVVLIDLDDFKIVNDTLGHKAGDRLLKTVAARLKSCVRTSDITARLGGDEFVLVLNNPVTKTTASTVVSRILKEVSETVKLEHREHQMSCSIGFSIFPDDGRDAEELLRCADSAMYQAKKNGKGNFQYFSKELQQQIQSRILMEAELRNALKNDEFVLHYQPQVDMRTGVIVGMEALVRWAHPEKGLIPPNSFIPLAEEIGLIVPIGDWVLNEACAQLVLLKEQGIQPVNISVNLSSKQLNQPDIIKHVGRILEKNNTNPRLITLEITESLSLDKQAKHFSKLRKLKELGVKISIDDFGTGYSNLNYLKRFPLNEIKIDKSFVDNITTDPHDKAIATTIIAIAHSLKLKVVAEGIESKQQLSILAKSGCDILQGYYFSKPLAVEELSLLLRNDTKLDLDEIRPTDYKRTILLVDDENNILSSLKRVLRKIRAEVHTASSGEEALEIMASNEIGIILSDLSMPNMNGIELLEIVQQMYPYTSRLILSGANEFESARDAINRSSIHKFITKPWTNELLIEEIEEAFILYENHFY